jgi:hypothetical protein
MRDRPAATDAAALERTPQILPVPLGGMRAARAPRSTTSRIWRRRRRTALIAVALIAACCGVWLSTTPGSFTVAMTPATVRVDDVMLTSSGPPSAGGIQAYTGPASLALSGIGSGTMHGGAVMIWKGAVATARCVLRTAADNRTSETCNFVLGQTQMSSTDVFDETSRTWGRRYGDGVRVSIAVPPGTDLMPIPFPLGR